VFFIKLKRHNLSLFTSAKLLPYSLLLLLFLLFSQFTYSQIAGEYRTLFSGGPHQWNQASNWEIYDGASFVTATPANGYPGEFSVPPRVTIQGGAIYRLNISTNIGELVVEGLLTMDTSIDRILNVGGNLSGAGSMDMNQSGRAHQLNLNGTNNAIASFNSVITSTVDYNRSGDQQVFGSLNYGNLIISGSGEKTLQGNTTVKGDLNIQAGILEADSHDFTVEGTTTIDGEFSDFSLAGALDFYGLITINETGEWNTLAVGSDRLIIRNGINHKNSNAGSFLANDAQFLVNHQTLSGNGPMVFAGYVDVAESRTLTNNNTDTVRIDTELNGQVGGSVWRNGPNSILKFRGPAAVMAIGALDASTNVNTVEYSRNGAQPILRTTYHHLRIGGADTKRYNEAGILTVNGDLTIFEGTFGLGSSNRELLVLGNTEITNGAKLDFGTTIAKNITLTGNLIASSGEIVMQSTGIPHNLFLSGEFNELGTLSTTNNAGSNVYYNRIGQDIPDNDRWKYYHKC
jgi:fibronectin-binding autotransporter adhesin